MEGAPGSCYPVTPSAQKESPTREHWVTAILVAAASSLVLTANGCIARRTNYGYDKVVAEAPARTRSPALAEPAPRQDESQAAISDRSLTLEDCIRAALVNNPDIRIAVDRIRQADATLAEASAAFLPVVTAETGFLRADAPSVSLFKTIDSRRFKLGTDFNNPGTFSNFETGLGVRYNLYRGGRDRLRRWVAQTGKDIRQLDRQEVENSLVASVIHAYYDIRAAEDFVQTAHASTETVRAQHQESRVKWEHGATLKSDVLSLEVRLAEAQEREIRAENSRKLTAAALANLLGGDADTPIQLAEADWDPGDIPKDYELALAEALSKRPELLRARQRVEQAAIEVESARRAFLPTADGSARVYWDDPDFEYDDDRTNWVVGVTLQWSLFEGGRRWAQLAMARSVLDEMLDTDRKATLALQLDVKTAYLRLDEARARKEVTRASVAQAEENLSLVRKQYEGGTATVTRYLEAKLMLTRARMRDTQAVYDLEKSLADVARAMGWLVAAAEKEDIDQ